MFVQAKAEMKDLDDQLERGPDINLKTPFVLRYGVPVLAVIAALIINRLLNVNMVGAPAMLFLCALMFSGLYSGAKPALLAMPLAVVAFAYYFVTPVNAWAVDVREGPRLVLFILASLFVISLTASQKRAAESLRRARDLLAGTVEELKRTNKALRTEITERERVEEELRARAADLTEAQRVGKIGNWILNLQTNRISWSEQIYRIFEVKEKDFDGSYESFVARIHPDDRALVRETNAQTRSEGSPFDIEYRAVTPCEEVRIIREVGYAARDEAGEVCRLFGTVQDITDRKLVEWALDERLRFETLVTELSATFANLPPVEVDGEIDKWLQRLVEFLGVDRASFLQLADDWTMLYRSNSYTVPGIEPLPASSIDLKNEFPWITAQLRRGITVKLSRVPDDLPEEATKDKETAARLGVKSGLNIPVRVGGSIVCAIAFTSILSNRHWPETMIPRLRLIGEIFAAAVLRKRADVALRKSEEQFRQMAENIREVFWLTTADMNKLLYISPAYEAVWGQSCRNLYEDPNSFFDTIHPEDRSRVASIHERNREKGFEVEYRVMRPDGSIRWIRDRGFPIHDESGGFYRLAGIAEDITDQKHAAALLHAKEQEFRAIVENAPDQIIRYDREFRRTYVNPAVAQFYGVPAETLVGAPLGIMKGPLDVKENEVAHVRERVAAVFSTGKAHDHDLTWTLPNGARHFNVRLFPEFDLNGDVVNVLGISRDVTERKGAEEALRSSEERLRLVIDTIPIMTWTLGPDGSVEFVNQRWLDYAGLTWEQYTHDQNGLIHPEDRTRAIKVWLANMATGNPYEAEMRLRRADGEYRWFLVRCAPLRDEQGQVVKWYGVSTDIEERKRAEALLYSKEQEFRAIVENAPDHISRYDRKLRRTYVNPAWLKSFNLPEEALIGKPMFSIIHDAGLDVEEEALTQIRQRYEDVFDTGESYEFEVTLPMPTGSRDYSVRIFPEFNLDGSVINVLSIARDITESKRAESELIKEKELLEKIFNNIPVLIGFVGEDGVKLVNPEWERTMGWTLKELEDQNIDIFTEAYPDLQYRQRVLDFVAAATGEWGDLKIRVRDGRVIDAACAVVQLSDGTKVAIAQDITERKHAEQKLRQSESQLAEAQHLANIGSWSLDLSNNTVTWSDELYRIFGVQPSEFDHSYETVLGSTHPDDREWLRNAVEHSIRTQLPLSINYRIAKPTGELRALHARGAVVTDEHGNATRLHGTAQDVTERMEGEKKLRATTEQLRALSARLQSAKEEEDIRIAREIHDEMGSTLTSLRWELERLDRITSESEDASQRQVFRTKIAEIMRLTDVTVGTMRRIASELRPSVLDDLGLTEAIEWQAQQFQTRTGIVCTCDSSLENIEFDPDQSTAIFRIFQEALRNVMSHSGATRVEVMTRKDDGEFVLTISDNGRGITEDEKLASLSLGVVGMRERAHLIEGELEISGTRGKGTVVAVRVPICREANSRTQHLSV